MESTKPIKLHARLSEVHQRGQFLNGSLGVITLLIWATFIFLVLFIIDWVFHLSSLGRMVTLALLLGYSFYKAKQNGWQFLKPFDLRDNALKVEAHYKNLNSLLVSGIQLYQNSSYSGTSKGMARMTIEKAEASIDKVKANEVVSYEKLNKPSGIAVGLCAILLFLAVVNTPLFMAGLMRIFTPWQDIVYPTNTHITLADSDLIVKEGAAVLIQAAITGDVPHKAKLSLRTGKGKPYKRNLNIVDGKCEYKLAAAFRSFDYCIYAGDAQSKWHTVKVISSPRILETKIHLTYPSYMKKESETLDAMTLTIPEGTTIEWHLTLDKAVSKASFTMEGNKPIVLKPSDNGLHVNHKMLANASSAYSYTWVEKDNNFEFNSSKHYLQVAPDQPPIIELTSPSKNIFATIGRKLSLAYRAKDDHGINTAKIVYRHNNLPEQNFPFAIKTSQGRSINRVDWDYRKAIKDLSIGESIAISIEVTDHYPGPKGGNKVRSESRRISFLSREDYLKKIAEQKERLLAILKTIYRQERLAHNVIKDLDPTDPNFEQTCFLESSRQDILIERIMSLNDNIDDLVEDLIANGITENIELGGLKKLKKSLTDVSNSFIANAASKLRGLAPEENRSIEEVDATAKIVDASARELGSLVLQLGINQAMEVFARELHVIAESQSILRLKTIEHLESKESLASKQDELAKWVNRLLNELSGNRDYTQSALLIVRLTRMVEDLRDANIASSMHSASNLLKSDNHNQAVKVQSKIIQDIFNLECHIRVGSEYEALINARDLFTTSINTLNQMSLEDSRMTNQQFKIQKDDSRSKLEKMHKKLRLLITPFIPTPSSELLAQKPNEKPDVNALIESAQEALQKSILGLQKNERDNANAQQQAAENIFHKLNRIIRRRTEERTKTSRYGAYSGDSMQRGTYIRELISSQARLLEKAEDADYDETSAIHLAPAQIYLSKDVLKTYRLLERKNKNMNSMSKMVPPMLVLLKEASDAMLKAGPALKENNLDDAIDYQDRAMDALKKALGLAGHEASGWVGLANLLITTEGAALPSKYMQDIVAVQHSLIKATKKSTAESREKLVDVQNNLVRAMPEVILLLEAGGSAMDFEQGMIFAGSDMGLSGLKLKSGEVKEAMIAQQNAAESLLDLSNLLQRAAVQNYYYVKVLEFLQETYTDTVVLLNKVNLISHELEDASKEDKSRVERLKGIHLDAHTLFTRVYEALGREDYQKASPILKNAFTKLKENDSDACLSELDSAIGVINENLVEMKELISKLSVVSDISPIEAPPEVVVMLDMTTLLVKHNKLITSVYNSDKKKLSKFVETMRDISNETNDFIASTLEHKLIKQTHKAMKEAILNLENNKHTEAIGNMFTAQASLRHIVLEYALYYIEIPRTKGSKKKKKGKSGIVTMFKMDLKLKNAYDKDWGGVDGDDPEAGRSEWEVLGSRDRAALNENFVRELPLEYRDVLKDYYERLAK